MNASNKISEAKKKREARNPINNSPINNKAQAPGTIMVLMSILTNNDKGHMFAEKLNKGETLSMEEFNEVLKHGAEGTRIQALDIVDEETLKPEDNFFFGISNQMYTKHKDRFKIGRHSYVAPLSLYRSFYNRKMGIPKEPYYYPNVEVSIGDGSNVQELRAFQCFNDQKKVKITIGNDSSCAHNVGFVCDNTNDEKVATFTIGSNVFVGINSTLKENSIIESGKNGNYTVIGFGCQLNARCKIGSGCIIGDGAIIDEGIEIPENMVILPGTHVTPTTLKERIKMEEVGSTQEEDQEIFNGLIDLGTGETEIENRKKLKELGPSLAFLHRFNDHVLEDNQAFPSMYRLIKRYHTDHHYIMEKREEKFVKIDSAQLDKRMPEKDSSNTKESYAEKLEKGKAEGQFVNVDLPQKKDEFLHHYYLESLKKKNDPAYEIIPYPGEFTNVEIDDTVELDKGTIMYNIGETKIKGNSKISGLVVNRSGDEGGSLEIWDSEIRHGAVFHAAGNKKITNSVVDRWSIVHGATTLDHMNLQENIVLNNVTAENGTIGSRSTLVGVDMVDTNIAKSCRMLGHKKGIKIAGSCISEWCVLRDGTTVTNTTSIPTNYRGKLDEVWDENKKAN